MKTLGLRGSNHNDDDSEWLSVSDLMAGLMMVFLIIAIAMIRSVMVEREKIRTIAESYRDSQVAIYESLKCEFADDLARWGAEIDQDTLTIAFNQSDNMFDSGKADLSVSYQQIFSEFFPRYLNVLKPYNASIEAVRIEGHTSSGWLGSNDEKTSYFNNLKLSQARARSVLYFVYGLQQVESFHQWMKRNVAAVGYSSSRPILNSDNTENRDASRRVAFRIVSNAEAKILSILQESW